MDYQEQILKDEAYLTALLADIRQAKQSIDLETYIFAEGNIGDQVVNALCDAAHRGVRIRILVDGIGTLGWGNSITAKLESAGIKTRVFHPLPLFFRHWQRAAHTPIPILDKMLYLATKINSRNHRKVCIIDQTIVYVGSANITDHLHHEDKSPACWRETTVRLVGINVEDIQYAFERAWGPVPFKKRFRGALKRIKSDAFFYLNFSWRRRIKRHKLLLNQIAQCQKRIWITNSYFAPEGRLLKSLIKASRRGVDVRILLPEKPDVFFSSIAASVFYAGLLKNGILIYEYLPCMLHAKILILDDWFLVGSSNLNYRSFRHDLEVDVNVKTQAAKTLIENQFLEDLSASRQVVLSDLKRQPFYKRMLAYFVMLIRFWF